jgi:Legume lectin domain
LLCSISSTQAAIRFQDFSSPDGIITVGDARISGKVLRLTPAHEFRSGAAWFPDKQAVASGFETTFQFQLTQPGGLGHGADGFAFVLQNSGSRALGGRGSAGGFALASPENGSQPGIPWSIAVFFDTFRNGDEGDPSGNYIAFRNSGKPAEMRWPESRLASTRDLRVHLKDRKVHTARIAFVPPVLAVFLDDSTNPVLQARVDLSIVVDQQGSAWVGFTASTGGGFENHDILNWSFDGANVSSSGSIVSSDITYLMWSCLPNRNLCTPERAIVEPNSTGYHIVLPANLEWGASVPNPSGRTVVVTNSHGIACWDLKAGADGCSGPFGNRPSAGAGFLDPGAPAGALIQRTREDRIWFSVNHRAGAGFQDNEGFFEFDVEIK